MKLGTGSVTVNPTQPIIKFGPKASPYPQVYPIKDDLTYQILILQNESEKPYIHISCPIADFELQTTRSLLHQIKSIIGYDFDSTLVITHTHYSVNVNEDHAYVQELAVQLARTIQSIPLQELTDPKGCFQYHYFDLVGQSRISGQPTDQLYLETFSLYDGEKRLATMITYNSHPTTISLKCGYLTAAGPGYVLRELKKRYPDEFFTYMIGAAGDVSTRFTRKNQDYSEMERLAKVVVEGIIDQLNSQYHFFDCPRFTVEEKWIEVDREKFDPSLHEFPKDLTEREKETLDHALHSKKEVDLLALPKSLMFQRLVFDNYQLIFAPFELFSEYIEYTNKENTSLVNCGNDRDGYLSGFKKQRLTMELIGQTVGREGKTRIKALLEQWSPKI